MTIFDKLLLLLLVVLLNVSINSSSGFQSHTAEKTLQLVAILHRHGFRTPERTWAGDPYADQKKYWPIGWGQLLPKGKQQLFNLGNTFRKYYSKFITEYTADSVQVNSSDLDRCHMSAASLLAGWFPPKGDQIWSKKLLWQPIPIHSVPTSMDKVIIVKAPCPRYAQEKAKIDQEMKANETDADKKFFKYLTKHMGENVTTVRVVETYYATMEIEDLIGYKMPDWTKKVYPKEMLQRALQSTRAFTWTDFMKRIVGGPLLKDILHHFKKKTEGRHKSKKLYLYSAHDSTIEHVWHALQFSDYFIPDFGAALMFELHQSKNDFFVKLKYMNDTTKTKPYELSIPNCPSPCKFAKLYEVTKYMRSVDWDKDCVI